MGVVHNSMVMDWKTIFTITIIGLGLLLFMFETVSSSATCIEKFADGKTTKDKRQFVAGERASLSCIITGMSSSDMLYWKWENNVMTQDEIVVNKFKDKFNVSLSKSNNVAVYNLTWITGINDVGKYNCTCTTGGLQFPVWIKRPCNNRTLHITNTSSREIVNFNKTLQPKELAMCTKSNPAEVLDLTIDLDCKCTWPEINRNFAGHWYKTCSNTNLTCKLDGAYKETVGHQDNSSTPIGCYAAGGAVTYRYQNVTGQLKTTISCSNDSMVGHTFALYIKESLLDKPDKSYKVLMAIKCPACPNKCNINGTYKGHNCTDARNITMDVGEAMFIMNIKPNECNNSSIDTGVDRTECCECIMKINCTKGGTIKPRYMNKEVVTVTCGKDWFDYWSTWWGIPLIVLGCLLPIGIIIGIVVWCCCKRKKAKEKERQKKVVQGQTNRAYSTSQNNVSTTSPTILDKKQTTLPPRERQPVREPHQPNSKDGKAENGRPADKYIVEDAVVATELGQVSQAPGGDFERKSKLADPSLRNDYEDVPPPIDPKKMCSYCSKQPSRGYFKPCGHSVVCVSCGEAQIQDTNRTVTLYCPKCSIAVNDYKRPCEVCLVNQVHGYLQPCGHSVACHSCVTNALTAGETLRCPKCGNIAEDFKNTCLICLERTVTGFLTPCGHLAACYQCTTKMLERKRAYCPECGQEVHDYKTSQSTSF